jgi:tRNA pseudouridine32 synthase/23S rRNA pseudouridine746 synthase
MREGRVLDEHGVSLSEHTPFTTGMLVRYFRAVANEIPIPFEETILYADEHLVIAEKPHFLPVSPKGNYVDHTLQMRLMRRLNNLQLTPVHRLDRVTAGLVMFAATPAAREPLHALFRERRIHKTYEALALALPHLEFPLRHQSRLIKGEPFFRMQEVPGVANSETWIEVVERGETHWRYRLTPVTGRKHQLRVHMASLGAPIINDDFYPLVSQRTAEDFSQPLKLLARSLEFMDPFNGELRRFDSGLSL